MDNFSDWLKNLFSSKKPQETVPGNDGPAGRPVIPGDPLVTEMNVSQSMEHPGVTEFEIKGQVNSGDDSFLETVRTNFFPGSPLPEIGTNGQPPKVFSSGPFLKRKKTGSENLFPMGGDYIRVSDEAWKELLHPGLASNSSPRVKTRGDMVHDALGLLGMTFEWNDSELDTLLSVLGTALQCLPWVSKNDISLVVGHGIGAEMRMGPGRAIRIETAKKEKDVEICMWIRGNLVEVVVDIPPNEMNPMVLSANVPTDVIGAVSSMFQAMTFDVDQSGDISGMFIPKRIGTGWGKWFRSTKPPWAIGLKEGDLVWINPNKSSLFSGSNWIALDDDKDLARLEAARALVDRWPDPDLPTPFPPGMGKEA